MPSARMNWLLLRNSLQKCSNDKFPKGKIALAWGKTRSKQGKGESM
ncbi:hypothetical protein BN2497_5221 [Janthinobacterium sp. CG23_2]|nr:hypothetical protein BN2497_5221 [Janthinobacterium sp. CG23_2]CUU29008.1 hypothetical protein BN3177_5221 [Janthinobacterium sp. CG23_2]